MTIAYSYIRFSTPAQLKGDSLRRQLSKTEKFATAHGLTLDTSLRDMGLSAFKGAHRHKGALASFLAKIEAGEIQRGSYLVVENMDRLSREQVLEALTLFLNIINAGVTVVTLNDDMVYSRESIAHRPNDLLISIGSMIKGNRESADKAERLQEVWSAKRDELGGRRKLTRQGPRWLDLVADDPAEPLVGEWRINDRAGVVQRIYQMCIDGFGKELIARRLNDDGVSPFRHGDGWNASAVAHLLSDRRVLGEFQPMTKVGGPRRATGEPITDYFPAIIGAETYYTAQRALQQRYTGARVGTKGRYPNLFVTIAKCGVCDRAMEYRDKRGKRNRAPSDVYLICSGCRRSERICSNTARHTYSVVEHAILTWVTDIDVTSGQANSGTVAAVKLGAKVAQRDDLSRRMTQALTDREEETDAKMRDYFKARARTLSAEIDAVEKEIEALTQEAVANKRSVVDDRRAALRALRAAMESASDTEALDLRAKLASALRATIQTIQFHEGSYHVVLHGGGHRYIFQGDHCIGRTRQTDAKEWTTPLVPDWFEEHYPDLMPLLA